MMNVEENLGRWIRTGKVPRRAEFGPGFQDDCHYRPGNIASQWDSRRRSIGKFGFALPCREALDRLETLSPLVEVGAGTGAWTAMLSKRGVDIIATDRNFATGYGFRSGRHHPVMRMDAENAVRRHPDRNLLMIWPCYGVEWPTRTIRLLKPGRVLALISEGAYGCCGADSLFRHLDAYFRHIETIRIPCWDGLHDRLDLYRRVIGAPPAPPSPKDWEC
jgi:hypothetical protein